MNKKYLKCSIALVIIFILGISIIINSNSKKIYTKSNIEYYSELEQELLKQDDENLISSKYLITDNTIERIRENTTGNDLNKELGIKVYIDSTLSKQVTSDIIKTGMVALDNKNNIYTLIVEGDVNKDGKVNSIDITKIIRNELDDISIRAKTSIDNISNYIVFGNLDIDSVDEVKSPTIEILSGTQGENDFYTTDVSFKININDNNSTKTVYKIFGSLEQDVTEINNDEVFNLNEDGVYKIVAYSYGKLGNRSKVDEKIIKINKTDIIATISYDPSSDTEQSVVATISFNKDNVIITNNDGNNTYEFTKNGSFTFEYKDEAGRTGNMVANVDWIYKHEFIGVDGKWAYFVNDDNTIQLSRYLGNETEITVPANYDGYRVYAVGNQRATESNRLNIFNEKSNTTLKKVTFEEGIEIIDRAAFSNCTGITSNLVFPSTLKKIEYAAFLNCSGLTGTLTIPDSVTYLGMGAFQNCANLTGTLKLSDNLEEIPNYAFNKCTGINSIIFPSNLKIIGRTAFQACTGLTGELNIPNTVTKIDSYAFTKCSNLTGKLSLPDNLEYIGDYTFNACSGLTGDITIPDTVTYLGIGAFQNDTGFNGTLTLSKNITEIGDYTFNGCTNLVGDIIIPENVTSIGSAAFNNCKKFNGTLTLPSTLKFVGAAAFNQCNNLTGDLIIPDNVETIGDIAFQSLTKMTGQLHLPSNIKSIGYFAFYDSKMSGELVLPEGLETMGHAVFGKCTNFDNEKVVIPSTLKKIGIDNEFNGENIGLSTHDFYNFGASKNNFTEFVVAEGNEYFKTDNGVLYTKDGKRLISYPKSKPDIEYEILEGVVTIDELSISSNTNLDTLIIPDSLNLEERADGIRLPNQPVLIAAQYSYTEVNNIVVKDTNPNYSSVDGVVYTKDMKEVVYISPGRTSQVIIPDGVERFRDKSLYYNQVYYIKISKIYIPASVTTISDSVISSINSNAKIVEVSSDNPNFTVDSSNKLIRK